MKILKTAVVGLGRIGWSFHIPKILAHGEQFALTAVVDVSQERLEEARNTYGVNGYTDIGEMIRSEQLDLVVIASPTHLHKLHACTAMEMGVDVFLDKPMADTYEAALEIAQCARDTGRKLMIYQPHRVFSEPNQLKAIIASGKIGRLTTIRRNVASYIRRADWQAFKKYGGGMLNNYGAHYIDSLLYMTEEKLSRYYCFTDRVATVGDADDVVSLLMKTESGVTLDINISQAAALAGPEWIVYGTTGAIISGRNAEGNPEFHVRWYDSSAVPTVTASDALAAANRSYNNEAPLPWQEEHIPVDGKYAIDFYGKVHEFYAEDKAPFVPVEETLYIMDTIRRCHEIAEG